MFCNIIIGADYRAQDKSGKCAFDYISDHKEWIDSGHFSDEVRARLKSKLSIEHTHTYPVCSALDSLCIRL